MRAVLRLACFAAALAVPLSAKAQPALTTTAAVRLAPGARGALGAWLVIGPFRAPTAPGKGALAVAALAALAQSPVGLDEARIEPSLGHLFSPSSTAALPGKKPPVWRLASSPTGSIDLQDALKTKGNELFAYAAGVLSIKKRARYHLLVGSDDGVRVSIDGKAIFARDESRPLRDDDDVLTLELDPGDHPVVLKLHQRDGGWGFHVRLLDDVLAPPAGAAFMLPGTGATEANSLAANLSELSIDRGLFRGGYRPTVTVRYPAGAPLGVDRPVRVRLARGGDAPLFDAQAGAVPMTSSHPDDWVVTLPELGPRDLVDAQYTLITDVAGRTVKAPLLHKKAVVDAIAMADTALSSTAPQATWLRPGTLDSIAWLRERLIALVGRGDTDGPALADEARELYGLADYLAKGRDPYAARVGPQRRAYVSPSDGALTEYALYVPPSYRPGTAQRYPLVVALHGMNGRPMQMIRWFFGFDDEAHDGAWEDRHNVFLPPLEAFVVAPNGHGNAMYRDLGEDDVLRAVDAVEAAYPIDRTRVSITGPSMGGIGTAAVAFRYPDRFAAAAPLCGYHSYFIRRDMSGRPLRPWEKLLAGERSNVAWAYNGLHLPLYVVHGTLDRPEANSGVLIDRYTELKYGIVHEHPNLGHNVWQTTYEKLKGANWLLGFRAPEHPPWVRFRTLRLRYDASAWVHVDALKAPDRWGEIDAHVVGRRAITARTDGVRAIHFDRDPALLSPKASVEVTVDGARLTFDERESLALHIEGDHWEKGALAPSGLEKRGAVTGPFREVFHGPLVFVYGASDPAQARANEEVARAFARVRWGVSVRYPVLSDTEFLAKEEPLANDRALFLVGNARSNRVLKELEAGLPIRVDGDAVVVGKKRVTGDEAGAAFVYPNPKRPDRYVAVIEGVTARGTWRALSLPDLLPDFIVYDADVAPARGQMVLGAGLARAAGFFRNDWSLPETTDDPLAASALPKARSEVEATPYLP